MNSKPSLILHDDEKIKELVGRMVQAEEALRTYLGDQVDAVLDPSHGSLTFLKQAQEALLEEVRYHQVANILQNVKDSIIVTDLGGIITYWNEGANSIHGREVEEVLGKPLWELHPDRDFQEFAQGVKSFPEENGYQREWQGEGKDGSVLWVESRLSLMRNVRGDTTGFILVERDITERKQAEEAMKTSEERLHYLSSELLNAQEKERRAIAHELHDGLGADLAAMKHSLETKIRQMGEDGGVCQISFDDILDLLKHTMDENRRIQLNLRPSILDDLGILSTMSWFTREFRKAYPAVSIQESMNIREEEVPEELKIVIFRIVQESTSNAVRHGKASLICIGLERAGTWMRLTVEDNGSGFTSATQNISPKSGTGLKSMQQRVDSSKGVFSVSSNPGSGTVVKAEWKIG